jgi:hypothetical protein
MMKIYSTVAAAALLAGAIVVAPQFSQVSASTRGAVSTITETTTSGKGDRLDIGARVTCKQQNWPYLDRACVRDPRTESGMARQVRLVSTDRR